MKAKKLNLFTYFLFVLGTALFAVGAVVGIKYCYDYFKEKIVVTDDTTEEDVTLVDGEKALKGVTYDMPGNITFTKLSTTSTTSTTSSTSDTTDSSAVTITATVGPDYAVNKILSWALAWTDNGDHGTVTDYVTITPSTDTLSCSVACSQAFGYQITLTASTTDGSNLSASTTLDYVKRISSIENDSDYAYTGSDIDIDDCIDFDSDYVDDLFNMNTSFTAGSITPTVSFDVYMTFEGDFIDNWQTLDYDSFSCWASNYCNAYSEEDEDDRYCQVHLGSISSLDFGKSFIEQYGLDLLSEDQFRYCINNYIYYDTFLRFNIIATVSYNDNTIQTFRVEIYTDALRCSYNLPVTSLSVDTASCVF